MLSKLFIDLQIKYPIDDLDLSFTDYIEQCKTLIIQHRLDLNTAHAEQIIAANSPFELRPSQPLKYGALLIHGLFDSPFIMRDIGLRLQAQGILTQAILLPGHGTTPGSLLHVDYRQWLQAVRYGIASLKKEVDCVFLVGYSTGASLALYHSLQDSTHIAGVVLLAPALKICSAFAGITHWHKALSWALPRTAWFHQDKEEMSDYARYRSAPFNAVYQVHRLTQLIHKAEPTKLPLLFALSQDDNIVCSRASLRYFQHQAHPKNQLLLYGNHAATDIDRRITLREAFFSQLNIRHFSHLALPISPQNLHYGEKGDYRFASHTADNKNTLYGEFSPGQIYFNEWLFKLKLSRYHYQRLSFNPDFDFLTRYIIQFMQEAIVK